MKREIAKKLTSLVVGYCASGVTGQVLANHVVTDTKAQKALVFVGSFGIGMVVGRAVGHATDELIDEVADAIEMMNNPTI